MQATQERPVTARSGTSPQADERARNRERLRRRAELLRDLGEARQLRERVTPRRSHRARMRAVAYMRTFRRPV